jgi:hypothetical protein
MKPRAVFRQTSLPLAPVANRHLIPRARRVYPESVEQEQGLLPDFPGDVFAETDSRMIPRCKRSWDDLAMPDPFAPYTGQPPIDDGPFSDCDPWHARHNANRIRPWLQPGLEAEEMTLTIQRHLGAFSGAKGGYLTVQATRRARNFTAVPTRHGNLTVD